MNRFNGCAVVCGVGAVMSLVVTLLMKLEFQRFIDGTAPLTPSRILGAAIVGLTISLIPLSMMAVDLLHGRKR